MIGTIEVFPQAHSPDFPLDTLKSFVNSPSSIRVRNVPRKVGNWCITNVFATIAYPDNTVKTVECVLTGGVYVATFDGCSVSGKVENGLTISANGKDENDNVVTGYVLGKGDVDIMDARDSVNPSKTVYYIHLLEDEPDVPMDGDMYKKDGNYVVYQNCVETQLGVSQENMESYVDQTVEDAVEKVEEKIPTKTSDLENDSGFITSNDIPTIPTKTSELENDSQYVTTAEVNTALVLKQDKLSNTQVSAIDSVVDERKTVIEFNDGTVEEYDWTGEITLQTMINEGIVNSDFDWVKLPVNVKIGTAVTCIGSGTFFHCNSLTCIVIPNSVTSIGQSAFQNTNIKNISLPDTLTSIGNRAFSVTLLMEMIIPETVTSIGSRAFNESSVAFIGGVTFKGKTLAEVQAMENYPWGITNTSKIKTFNVASKEWVEERLAQLLTQLQS